MSSLGSPLAAPLGGDDDGVTLYIVNPSRGVAVPTAVVDPTGTKAVDSFRISVRETQTAIDLAALQMGIGFAKTFTSGTGLFERLLPRTKRSSLLQTKRFTSDPTVVCTPPNVMIAKTVAGPQPSVYFTSVDSSEDTNPKSVMVSVTLDPLTNPVFQIGANDPMGPVFGLENGPRNTAVYVFLLDDPVSGSKVLRVCGPNVGGHRSPDVMIPYNWNTGAVRYTLFWSEQGRKVYIYAEIGTGVVGSELLAAIPISDFQQFGSLGTALFGGAADYTAVYGVEGVSSNSANVSFMALATDVRSPLINGAQAGDTATTLAGDFVMGFSGAVDPTRLHRSGAWFRSPTNDSAGTITPSAGGYCRLRKKTPGTIFSIFRDEPGLLKTTTDGLMVEFKINIDVSGIVGAGTGGAIKISDGTTLFQLDFLFDGHTKNIGLLKLGGDPSDPSGHLLAPSPIDWTLKTLRFTVDTRRGLMELYDTVDLTTPLMTWPFSRDALPTSLTPTVEIGLAASAPAVGAFDIYSFKYSYIYQTWEARDLLTPMAANPSYIGGTVVLDGGPLYQSVMPGAIPLAYYDSIQIAGNATFTDEGYQITATGGESDFFYRNTNFEFNSDRGCGGEARFKISRWHPKERTGQAIVIDDGLNAYILSFVETDSGKFACVPLAAGFNQFEEFAGQTGLGAKLSCPVDWTKFHTYRLERKPRDGVYVFIDNVQTLYIPDRARYVFPNTQFDRPTVGFGALTQEGGTSTWKFARFFFGSGYEVSTELNVPQSAIRDRLSSVHVLTVMSAAGL